MTNFSSIVIDCLENFNKPSTTASQPKKRGRPRKTVPETRKRHVLSPKQPVQQHTDNENITLVRSLSLFTCLCFTYPCFCFALQDKSNRDASALPGNIPLDKQQVSVEFCPQFTPIFDWLIQF